MAGIMRNVENNGEKEKILVLSVFCFFSNVFNAVSLRVVRIFVVKGFNTMQTAIKTGNRMASSASISVKYHDLKIARNLDM